MQIDPAAGGNGVPGVDRTDTATPPVRADADGAMVLGASMPPAPAAQLDGMLRSSLRAMAAAAAADTPQDVAEVEDLASRTADLIAGSSTGGPGAHDLDSLRVRDLLGDS